MTDLSVLKFEPHGPAETGMLEWEPMSEAECVSQIPVQRGHEYLTMATDDQGGGMLYAGVWDCTPFETPMEPYSVHEFMHILEGSVSIVEPDGNTQTFSTGDSFVIPKGFVCQWKQTEYLRKYYVIFDDASKSQPEVSVGAFRVDTELALDPLPEQDPAQFEGDVPTMHQLNLFSDASSRFAVGLWASTAMCRVPGTIARSELMHILEGEGSIINGDGAVFDFVAGDTFMVPVGMGYQWKSEHDVKKIYCMLHKKSD